jgi:hypothetical protein
MIDPTISKCDEANELLFLEVTPEFASRKHALAEEPSNSVWRVQPREGRQGLVKRYSMNRRHAIHVFYC